MARAGEEIAARARELKVAFLGVQLALGPLMDPELPLMDWYMRRAGQTLDSPIEIYRKNGTMHSSDRLVDVLRRATEIPGAGLRADALPFAAMYGATAIVDDIYAAELMRTDQPLLQFARHLRNACAHGNRWHFVGSEPRHPARLRRRRLTPRLHGTRAVYGWLGPGDYLDFLDDLAALCPRLHC